MPNNAYLRSTKREREIVNAARAQGFAAGRTAGSHSPFDLYIWNPQDKVLRLVQVKTKKGGSFRIEKDLEVFHPASVITATYSYEKLRRTRARKNKVDL